MKRPQPPFLRLFERTQNFDLSPAPLTMKFLLGRPQRLVAGLELQSEVYPAGASANVLPPAPSRRSVVNRETDRAKESARFLVVRIEMTTTISARMVHAVSSSSTLRKCFPQFAQNTTPLPLVSVPMSCLHVRTISRSSASRCCQPCKMSGVRWFTPSPPRLSRNASLISAEGREENQEASRRRLAIFVDRMAPADEFLGEPDRQVPVAQLR